LKKVLQTLPHCPLFDGIGLEECETMLDCIGAEMMYFPKGETILAEGDPAGRLGVILRGNVQVVRMGYDGNRSMLAKLGRSDLFAEVFACAGAPTMPVSVIADEDTEVMMIDAGRILHVCGSGCHFHHQLVYNLMKILARKNLMSNQKLEILSKRTTREKLMTYLLLHAKQKGSCRFSIPYNRQELADYLEVDRSGLSSEISKLRRAGIIECDKNEFVLRHIPD